MQPHSTKQRFSCLREQISQTSFQWTLSSRRKFRMGRDLLGHLGFLCWLRAHVPTCTVQKHSTLALPMPALCFFHPDIHSKLPPRQKSDRVLAAHLSSSQRGRGRGWCSHAVKSQPWLWHEVLARPWTVLGSQVSVPSVRRANPYYQAAVALGLITCRMLRQRITHITTLPTVSFEETTSNTNTDNVCVCRGLSLPAFC